MCFSLIDSCFILPCPQFCNGINACPRGLEARILSPQALHARGEGDCVARAGSAEKMGERGWTDQEKLEEKKSREISR